jgi:tetratricopeptide (TPR) repeat protein
MRLLKVRTFLVSILFILLLTPPIIQSQTNDDITAGVQLFETKKFPEAKKFFEAYMTDNQNNPVAASYLGRIFLREGNYEKAITWLEKAIKIDDNNSNYHLWLGRAYGIKAQRAGLLKKASAASSVKKHFERAVELNPENINARMGLLQFYLMAPGIMGGSKDKARTQADEIMQRNAHQGHLALGFIHSVNEKYDLAEQEYHAAIALDSMNTQPYFSLGYLYARQKQFDNATDIFENLLKSHPDEVASYFHLGRLAVMSGKNLDKGEEYLKKYLQTDPSDEMPSLAFTHLLLGHIYKMKENKELAKDEYQKALELDPDFKQAKQALKDL